MLEGTFTRQIKIKTSFILICAHLFVPFTFGEGRLHLGNPKKNKFSFGISLDLHYLCTLKRKLIINYMYKKLFLTAAVMMAGIQMQAQTVAPYYKGTSDNNPISPNIFCADPTALEYNGRLYVYGSNDHQQFIANGKKGENSYGEIKSIVVFSTDDMVNWTFHGTIDTKKLCASWVTSPWYVGYGVSWAPSVTWRTTEDGTDEFFLYFCNSSHGVGVLKANSPIGPWSSPNKKLMINYDTSGANAAGTNANFDPGVVIDENGVGWISFGGLGPSTMMPEAARIVKLKPSMIEVDGSAVKIPAPYHFEANELNVMDGKFVYTYCSNWAERKDSEWNAYKAEKGITASKPGTCTMCYMVSDNPTDPDSWVYKGVYGPHPGTGTNNNHSHLQKFQGEYYYLYHGAPLMESWRNAGVIDKDCGIFRSSCVNKATVNEATQKISTVTPSLSGVTAIKNVNPYELLEAETMANCGGVEYEDFTNIKKYTKINSLGNDASRNLQVNMKAGSWIQQRGLDFGETGAAKFMLRAKGSGTMEIHFGSRPTKPAATFEFSSTDMEDHIVEINTAKFHGVKNVCILARTATDVYVDAWQFIEAQPTGIQEVEGGKATEYQSYDLSGRSLSGTQQHRGVVIKQYTDGNGVKHSRKVLSEKQR
jgi:arabinoxylan arabinofuranohydrolase